MGPLTAVSVGENILAFGNYLPIKGRIVHRLEPTPNLLEVLPGQISLLARVGSKNYFN
jgi:hypothetical protein